MTPGRKFSTSTSIPLSSRSALRGNLAGGDPKVQLEIANSIWARQGFTFEQDFLDRNRQFFDARVSELDFGDPTAKDVINGWVSDRTHGRIPTIIDRISAAQVMFLINAVYFKGEWKTRFDPARTTDRPFRTADGTSVTVPMMNQAGKFSYLQSDGTQVVSLPYGDGRFSMTFILPDEPPVTPSPPAGPRGNPMPISTPTITPTPRPRAR